MTQSHRQRFTTAIKLLLIASLVAIAIAARSQIQAPLQASLLWVESLGSFRPLAFISIYNLATILFVPGSLLTMGGGAIFGLVWGTIYVTIAAILGATLAFILGRYFCRDFVKNKIGDRHKFQAINRAVAAEGLKIVLLTRLCPIFPFNLSNYIFGITEVTLKDYIVGSLGIVPGTVMYVYLGDLIGDLAKLEMSSSALNPEVEVARWSIKLVSFIATVAIAIYLSILAKKYLNRYL